MKTGRKANTITHCKHTHLRHFAKGMCNHCYHRFGRVALVTECEHKDRKAYAKGKCQNCYINAYNKAKRKKKKESKLLKKPTKGTRSTAKLEELERCKTLIKKPSKQK
jgi:hypothetical protein